MSEVDIDTLSVEAKRRILKQARRDHRLTLQNAVREELFKQPLKMDDLIKSAHDSIVSDVVKRLEMKGGALKALEDRLDALLREALGNLSPDILKKMLVAAAEKRAAELISANVEVVINKEKGSW